MDRRVVVLVLSVLYMTISLSGATICKPNSKFKIDCNSCTCGSNGKEYTCTTDKCQPTKYEDNFYITQTKDGHKLLVPKDDQLQLNDNNILTAKSRKPRIPAGYPYLNDEMFPRILKRIDNSKKFDIEIIKPNKKATKTTLNKLQRDQNIDDEDSESNDINRSRWARFVSRKQPVFPE